MLSGRDWTRRGNRSFLHGDFIESINSLNKAGMCNDEDSHANVTKVEASMGLGTRDHICDFDITDCLDESESDYDSICMFPDVAIFEESKKIDEDPWNAESVCNRASWYNQIGDKFSAIQDIQTMVALMPNSHRHIEMYANIAYETKQPEILLTLIKHGKKKGMDMFLHHCRYLLMTKKYKELSAACQRMNNAIDPELLKVRLAFNCALGNYKKALSDALKLGGFRFPWTYFMSEKLPFLPGEPKRGQDAFIRAVINGFRISGLDTGGAWNCPITLGIAIPIQRAWVFGDNTTMFDDPTPDFPYREGGLDPKKFTPSLIKEAINFGKMVLPASNDKRKLACLGFAIVEISQIYDAYINGGDVVPCLENTLSLIVNWLRVADPSQPLFESAVAPEKTHITYLIKDGIQVGTKEMTNRAFAWYVSCFPDSRLLKWSDSKSVSEMIQKNPLSMECQITGTHTKIFSRMSEHQHPEFGVKWQGKPQNKTLIKLLTQLFSDVKLGKRREVCYNTFKFFYKWLKQTPFTACSAEIGSCLFVAMLHSFLGLEIERGSGLPSLTELEFNALSSPRVEDFMAMVNDEFAIQFVRSENMRCLPNITEVMPSWPLRIRALQEIEEDDLFI